MADDKKNIPDAGKVDEPPKPGKVEPVKADHPVQDQPAPAKAGALKDKDAPAPSMEGSPQPGKDEKQTTIPGMGDSAPAGKVVDFTAAREGAAKGKPPEKAAAPPAACACAASRPRCSCFRARASTTTSTAWNAPCRSRSATWANAVPKWCTRWPSGNA